VNQGGGRSLSISLAATSFAEATVVKKNAKGAKKWKTSDY
jgi:hypothetical protein